MSEANESKVDRTDWGAGPWDSEPDRLEWRDEATGLPCLIVRNPVGALCGYVGVNPGHPWHGLGYNDCPESCGASYCDHALDARVEAHGGLTYADRCAGPICHVPAPGEPEDVWWFGFDCAHHMDVSPGMAAFTQMGTYRDVTYVRAQVSGLAEQLAKVA